MDASSVVAPLRVGETRALPAPFRQSGALPAPVRRGAAVACRAPAPLLTAVGLVWGLFFAPADWQQGDAVRIMYVHVPAAWLASAGYFALALCSVLSLVWRHPLADLAAVEIGPVGAGFTALCLLTGSIWGKPMWGAWWVWDARLTSVLVLFFLYLGHIALVRAFDDPERGYRVGRDPGAGRRGEPADHQVQRRLVEHAAPAGDDQLHRRADACMSACCGRCCSPRSATRWCSPPSCVARTRAAVMERRIRALLMARAE